MLVDLHIPTEYDYVLSDIEIKKVGPNRIEGVSHQLSRNVWSNDADQDYRLYFVLEFDQPIQEMGGWTDGTVVKTEHLTGKDLKDAGLFLQLTSSRILLYRFVPAFHW